MVASLQGSLGTGTKGRGIKYWARLGCWISPCYSPLSLDVRFETYELLISLIFQIFSARGKLHITETVDIESVDTGVCLYLNMGLPN